MRFPDFFRTTAFRQSLAIAAFFTASSLAVFAFVYWQTVAYASEEVDHEVEQISHAIGGVTPYYVDRRLKRWLKEQTRIERYGLLVDAEQKKLAGNMEKMPDRIVYDGTARTYKTKGLDGDSDDDSEIVRGVGMRMSDGRWLFLGEDTDEWEYFRDVVIRALVLGLFPTFALACAGGALFGRSVLGRMSEMNRSIDRIVRGDVSERLPRNGKARPDEIDQLADRVNLVLDEWERLLREAQTVGDSIAHDLRTPLTRMRIRLEGAKTKTLTSDQLHALVEESVHWLDQTLGVITAVLRIGEIEHGRRRAAFRAFDLVPLLREVSDLMEPLADEKGVGLALQIEDQAAVITGDRELILEALVNLVDNAIKFTPAGGECAVRLSKRGEAVAVTVRDTGPGISPAERSAVLRRFYKGSAHRNAPGHGLGLALVAAVARLHDFDFAIDEGQVGCKVRLTAKAEMLTGSV